MRKFGFVLTLMLFAPLTSTSILADGPVLKMKAPRPSFMRPRMPNERTRPRITMRVTAELTKLDELEDPADLEKYYCLDEVWDWDDDTDSEHAPDCDPYEEGMELKTRFSASHQYDTPGTYNVWLRLQRNGKTVIAGNAKVQIRN